MKVLILGLAKSGTTALAYRLKDSWPEGRAPHFLFEPRRWEPPPSPRGGDVLAKVLIGGKGYADYESFRGFDRPLFIIRDPRDTLVSRILYNLYEFPRDTPESQMDVYIQLIEKKIIDPEAVTLMEICALMLRILFPRLAQKETYPGRSTILDFAAGGAVWQEAVETLFPQRYTLRYEDFVRGEVDSLADYLGFPLDLQGEVPPVHSRVTRSRSSGEWVHWFNKIDLEDFLPAMEPFLLKWGYSLAGQEQQRAISRETSLVYLQRLKGMRRERYSSRTLG